MARYDRNRGMYFGSWDGKPIAESAEIACDNAQVTVAFAQGGVADFGTAVGKSGEYVFMFNGTKWELNSVAIDDMESSYGITVSGSPAINDMIDVNYTAASGGWEALGKDNDDLSKELNADTEKSKNVLGETTFRHSGYEPEISLDPYYIDPSRKMYKRLLKNAIEEKYGEADLLGKFAEAFFTTANKEKRIMTGYCYVRDAWFVPNSTGGDTTAYAIPVTITPVGAVKKMKIVYDMTTNEATITEIPEGESPIIG